MSEHDHRDGGRDDAPSPSRDGMRGPTLPPPAFPPGTRRTAARRNLQHDDLRDAFYSTEDADESADHADAFFSPDDPFPTQAAPARTEQPTETTRTSIPTTSWSRASGTIPISIRWS